MKKIVLMMALVFGLSNLYAQSSEGMEFFHGSWAEVKAQAKKEKKNIFIDCYTVWCGPCKKLSKQVFPQKIVGDYFNANFVNYKVDMEKGEGIQLKKIFKVAAFPTLLFVNSNGEVIHKIVGSLSADKLIQEAKNAPEKKILTDKIIKDYETNKKDPVKVRIYLDHLISTYDGKASEVAEHYLSIIPKEKYLEEDVFSIISRQIKDPASPVIEYLCENKELHDKEIGKYRTTVKRVVDSKYALRANKLANALKNGDAFDEKSFQNLVSLMEHRNYKGKDKVIKDTELKLLEYRNDWKGYAVKVDALLENDNYPKKGLVQILYRWCTPIVKSECNDKEVLKKAVAWMDRLIEVDDNFQIYFYAMASDNKVKLLKRMNATKEEIQASEVEAKLFEMLKTKQMELTKKNKGKKNKNSRGIPKIKMF